MAKVTMKMKTLAFPMPAFVIGANVDGKANFMTAAWSGIAGSTPPMITVALQHHRHTLKGMKQNMTFSVNVPSEELVKETDYCGIVSGTKEDKTAVCDFKVFYGVLQTAPLIEQYPVNLECKIVQILDVGSHELIVGRIEEAYVSEECLTDGRPDVAKIKPIAFAGRGYYGLGEMMASAFTIGKELDKTKTG